MTPEREKLIRAAWARGGREIVQRLADARALQMLLHPPKRASMLSKAPATPQPLDIVTVTMKLRELTWSAMCEGLELGSYRR